MVPVESWLTSPGRSTIRSAVLGEAHGECGAGGSGFDADVCAEFADQRESHAQPLASRCRVRLRIPIPSSATTTTSSSGEAVAVGVTRPPCADRSLVKAATCNGR